MLFSVSMGVEGWVDWGVGAYLVQIVILANQHLELGLDVEDLLLR